MRASSLVGRESQETPGEEWEGRRRREAATSGYTDEQVASVGSRGSALLACSEMVQDSALHTFCCAEFTCLAKLRRTYVFVKHNKMENKDIQNPSPTFLIIRVNGHEIKVSDCCRSF